MNIGSDELTLSKLKSKIEEHFKQSESNLHSMLNQLALFIFSKQMGVNDLYILGKYLSYEQIVKLSDYYNGDAVRMPKREDLKQNYLLALTYFLKEIQGWDWDKIKKYLDYGEDFSAISYGKMIKSLKFQINQDLDRIINTPKDFKDLDDITTLVKKL
jgi:hypothetical protein